MNLNHTARSLLISALLLTGANAADDSVDSVIQPGIVEEILPPQQERAEAPEDDVVQPGIVEAYEGNAGAGFDKMFSVVDNLPIQFSLTVERYSDSNVLVSDTGAERDMVWEFVPKATFETSPLNQAQRHYLLLEYDPQNLRYDRLSQFEAWNQRGFARYRFIGGRFNALLVHRSMEFSSNIRDLASLDFNIENVEQDIGQRVSGELHRTLLTTETDMGAGLQFHGDYLHVLRSFSTDQLSDFEEDQFLAMIEVGGAGKLAAAVGGSVGWVELSAVPDQSYQQLLGEIVWMPSQELTFTFDGGVDFRSFDDPFGADDSSTALFSAEAEWRPTDRTLVTLTGFQDVRPSVALLGQNFVVTGIKAQVRHEFGPGFFYRLRGGYERADYESTMRDVIDIREDDYYYVDQMLGYEFGKRGEIGVFHEFRDRQSNTVFAFDRAITGVSLRVVY